MFDVFSALHQSDIPCSKGERLFIGRLIGVDINIGIAINAKGGDCWIMLSLMPMV
jgi:hypothetical protein